MFNAGNRASARLMIQNCLSIFREDKQYKLADWFEENVEECLTVIDCLPEVQRRLRTSNMMESINRQLKRRTSPEKLQLAAEALQAASSQPANPAA